jgi:hypothetical protein
MAVIRDLAGVVHLVDIFDGGTWCGCDWGPGWEPLTDRLEFDCPACEELCERADYPEGEG